MLTRLEIDSTKDTPYILFDKENNAFEINGSSLPENTSRFFEPIFNWIEEYIKSPNEETHLICNLDYFNSSSAKMIFHLFLEFEKIQESGNHIQISWYYDPDDALLEEKGLEYQSILKTDFKLVTKA